MNGQIVLPTPLIVDADGWSELVTKLEGAMVLTEFMNPMTGERQPVSSDEVTIKVDGESVVRANLIAKQEVDGQDAVAFRLPPFRDAIEFEVIDSAGEAAVKQLAKIVGGEIERF